MKDFEKTNNLAKEIRANQIIFVPGSKSLTNRAVHLAGFCSGTSYLKNYLNSADTKAMILAWEQIGADISEADYVLKVSGISGHDLSQKLVNVFANEAGTVLRFLLPIFGEFAPGSKIDCAPSLACRPINDLNEALDQISDKQEVIYVRGDTSSQFLSGLLMALPFLNRKGKSAKVICLTTPLVSKGYVEMTLNLLSQAGIKYNISTSFDQFTLQTGDNCETYKPLGSFKKPYEIEGDWSSASYFLAEAAINSKTIVLENLFKNSLQSDQGLLSVLNLMGCSHEWIEFEDKQHLVFSGPNFQTGEKISALEVDMHHMSDAVPALAIVCAFASGISLIKNVANMRVKECNRLHVLATELAKLGIDISETKDGLRIAGRESFTSNSDRRELFRSIFLDPHGDHRMAMAFGIMARKFSGIEILNKECVAKTFPNYWELLKNIL